MASRRTWRTRGIVIDRTKLGETDLILTVLDAEGAQVRAVAKGARKPGGRFASRVQLFCELDLLLARGRSLDIVSEAALVEPHVGLRGDLERVSAASAVCEVAQRTCFEDATDPFLMPVCSRALLACEQASDQAHLDLAVAAYIMKVLSHQGWRPELDGCVACGDAAVSRFSPTAGGCLCESCARDLPGAEPVDSQQVRWIGCLVSLTFDELLAAGIDGATAAFLLATAHRWAATHLECRLRSLEFAMSL